MFPRFIPGLVAVNAFITVVRDGGTISRIGSALGIPLELGFMYSAKGIIYMNLWFNIPFATMMLLSGLSAIKDPIIESAKDTGANKFEILKTIILPLTFKDILITSTFVFMGNVGSFTTPYLIGGNHPKMLGIILFDQFNSMDYEKAVALSVIIFIICLGSAAVYIYTNMKKSQWDHV